MSDFHLSPELEDLYRDCIRKYLFYTIMHHSGDIDPESFRSFIEFGNTHPNKDNALVLAALMLERFLESGLTVERAVGDTYRRALEVSGDPSPDTTRSSSTEATTPSAGISHDTATQAATAVPSGDMELTDASAEPVSASPVDATHVAGESERAADHRVDDEASLPPLTGEAGDRATEAETSAEGPFDIRIHAWPRVTYAFSHNRVPVVPRLAIGLNEPGPKGLLKIAVEMTWSREAKPPAKPVSLTIECPESGESPLTIDDVGLKLDDTVLVDLEEAVPATIRVTVRTSDGIAQYAEHDVRILARNQWFLQEGYLDLLAAYVQPNHPATREVLKIASGILQKRTGSASIEGYQSGPERATEIGRAIFEALKTYDLTYIDPPASFEESQKVRPLDEVLDARAGTCIDLACAYASCLEQAGLHPLIWIVPGHAFGGFFTESRNLNAAVERNPNTILTLRDSGLTVPVETVAMTNDMSFQEAVSETRLRFDPETMGFVVDVHRSHRGGTLPLPARVTRDGVVTVVIDPGPGSAPVVEKRDQASGERLPDIVPPRIARWKSSLLDLSFRNPLLNFSTGKNGLDLLVPPGKLGELEDDLHNGTTIQIMPGDALEGAETAAGLRNITEASAEAIGDLFDRLRLLYSPSGAKEGAKATRKLNAKARLLESETGANNLYLVLGTLIWKRGTDKKEVRSPLFLVPIRMTRPKGTSLFGITLDENGFSAPNYCLAEKLKAEFKLDAPFFEQPDTDAAGVDIDGALANLRKALLDKGLDFRVDESAHLAVLQFGRFRLWKDMDDFWQSFMDNPIVEHLVDSPGEMFRDPAGPLDDVELAISEVSTRCPIPADGTQLRAIVRAEAGHSFVIEGPPGTGKSQTITNLLANALATKKTVLFVAEKQAALSVVRDRLIAVGLDPYCLDLHDKGSKPEQIRAQLLEALDHRPTADLMRFDEAERTLASLHGRLAEYRDKLYEENPLGLSFARAHERILELGDGPAADVPRSLFDRDTEEIRELRSVLLDAAPIIIAARPEPLHPWRFAAPGAFDSIDRPGLANAVTELAAAKAALVTPGGRAGELLSSIATAVDLESAALLVETVATRDMPDQVALDQAAGPEWRTSFDRAISEGRTAVSRTRSLAKTYGKDLFARPLVDFRSAHAELDSAAKSFFLMRGGKVRNALAALLGVEDPPKLSADEAVTLGAEVIAARTSLETARKGLSEIPGITLPKDFRIDSPSALDELELRATRLVHLADLLSRPGDLGTRAREFVADPGVLPPGFAARLKAFAKAVSVFLDRAQADPHLLQDWTRNRGLVAAIERALPKWTDDAREARFLLMQRWTQLVHSVEPLRNAGLEAFVGAILDGEVPGNDADVVFQRGLLNATVRERGEATGLDTFDRVAHEQVIGRYLSITEDRRDQLQQVIPYLLDDARTFNANSGFGAVNELKIELQRKRGAKSVRQIIESFPDLVQQLTPCFLMSPYSVAKFIPPGSLMFDMVVFDEASQIDVAEAVGAMGRARSVVIVGDSKQMPPTKFFGGGGSGDDMVFVDDRDDDELPEDGESLLIEAVEAGMDREWLAWHYRSQDESLIAFSNTHYYDGRLSSFPNPSAGSSNALEWRRIDGQYEHGGDRVNRAEAAVIVEEIVRRVHDPRTVSQTLGVVTLNSQQQDEVTRLLHETGDVRVQELLESEGEESIFVRNLENVQGHERDVILLSTAFSKKADGGPMPLQFGPLNRAGGERRLNVAVTRARQQVVIFSSFEPEDIDDKRTSALGLLHLREFLMMAKYGVRTPEEVDVDDATLDRYRVDVREALEKRGLVVGTDVGLSPFRVDLAVTVPGRDRWDVAVLLDGLRWKRRSTVGDRDGLPVTVLRNLMGWPRVARVWLPSWRVEREAIANDIAELVQASITQEREEARLVEEAAARAAEERQLASTANVAAASAEETAPMASAAIGASTYRRADQESLADARFVVSISQPLPDDLSGVVSSLSSAFQMPVDKVEWLLSRAPGIVTSPLPRARAEFTVATLREVGLSAELQRFIEPATTDRSSSATEPGVGNGSTHDSAASEPDPFADLERFEPFPTEPLIGSQEECTVDGLSYMALATVKLVIQEEGPVELRRLAKAVATRFDINRLHSKRADTILRSIPKSQIRKSEFGEFAWPKDVDPTEYVDFRISPEDGHRTVEEIAPEELSNALRHVAKEAMEIDRAELIRVVAAMFGIKRVTSSIEETLDRAVVFAGKQGKLVFEGDRVRAA